LWPNNSSASSIFLNFCLDFFLEVLQRCNSIWILWNNDLGDWHNETLKADMVRRPPLIEDTAYWQLNMYVLMNPRSVLQI
jgi:hypothetical protein